MTYFVTQHIILGHFASIKEIKKLNKLNREPKQSETTLSHKHIRCDQGIPPLTD